MKTMKIILASLVVTLVGALAVPQMAQAASIYDGCKGGGDTRLCKNKANSETKVKNLITAITNIMLFIVGAVSVIMIIVGGIQYAASAGDPGKAKSAKNTILYAAVGAVIAVFAYAIVNFVVTKV